MTKRRRLCIAICILSLAIAGGLVLAIGLGNRGEPVYQGKTLSLWLDDYYNSSYSSGTRRYDPAAVRFEVANIPTNSSVEVACIIDHQQILLCARDYNRKQFVELRRVDNGTK